MPASRVVSVYADPPVYAAGRAFSARGAAAREDYDERYPSGLTTALIFLGGVVAGVLATGAIVRAVIR